MVKVTPTPKNMVAAQRMIPKMVRKSVVSTLVESVLFKLITTTPAKAPKTAKASYLFMVSFRKRKAKSVTNKGCMLLIRVALLDGRNLRPQ